MSREYIQKRLEKNGYKLRWDLCSGKLFVTKNNYTQKFNSLNDAYKKVF